MRDVFYTLLIVWLIWRIMNSVNSFRARSTNYDQQPLRKEGETTVDYIPPSNKKKISDNEGDYVDYEEIK